MPASNTDRLQVQCASCHARLAVPSAAAGKKAKCPKCGQAFVIQPAAAQPEPEGLSLLDDLVAEANTARAISPPAPQPAPMPSSALRTGARPPAISGKAVARSAAAGLAGAAGNLAKGAGKFLIGCVLSFAGAMIGAGVWCGIAVAANVEFGFVAWGLGLLAGIGMYVGYRQKNARAGLVAACIALVGVIAAKAFIFSYVVYAVVSGNTNDTDLQRVYIARVRAEQILLERGVGSQQELDAQWDQAYAQAENETQNLTPEQVRARAQEYRQWEQEHEDELAFASTADEGAGSDTGGGADSAGNAEYGSEIADELADASESDDEATAGLGAAFADFLKATCEPIDLLFVVLAVLSAFRIGSGAFGGE